MKVPVNPEDLRVAICFLRAFRGLNQTDMARAAGMDKSQLSLYEQGRKVPTQKTVERLVRAVGLPFFLFEDVLGVVRIARVAATDLNVDSTAVAQDIAVAVAASLKLALNEALAELSREVEKDPFAEAPEEARAEAEELWGRLRPHSNQDRRLLVGEGREYGSWALVERLCHECGETVPNDPIQAQEMAELALLVAARTPGNDGWRSRLQGYAWAFLGDARRSSGDTPGAEEAFQRARVLWNAGSPENIAFLDENRFRELQPN